MPRNVKYQLIQLTITGAGLTASTNDVTTDKLYKKVKGIQVTVSSAIAIEATSFDKFQINSQEIYPTGFEVKLISCNSGVPPNERFDIDVDEPGAGATVDITVKDNSVAATVYPYTVNVYLRLENDPNKP